MADDDYGRRRLDRLVLRLALLRQRIEERCQLCKIVTHEQTAALPSEFAERVLITREAFPSWRGESVVLWHKADGSAGWAAQLACPHASIPLAESDIEDFGSEFPRASGPCIACPAHMYVFDLGSGRCLTDDLTVAARLYPVHITEHRRAESAAGDPPITKRAVWVSRHFSEAAANTALTSEERRTGNAIQLRLGNAVHQL